MKGEQRDGAVRTIVTMRHIIRQEERILNARINLWKHVQNLFRKVISQWTAQKRR